MGRDLNIKDSIVREIEQVPDAQLQQVLDSIRFIKAKSAEDKLEATLLSESSLLKDWLRPEEDEAWQDL